MQEAAPCRIVVNVVNCTSTGSLIQHRRARIFCPWLSPQILPREQLPLQPRCASGVCDGGIRARSLSERVVQSREGLESVAEMRRAKKNRGRGSAERAPPTVAMASIWRVRTSRTASAVVPRPRLPRAARLDGRRLLERVVRTLWWRAVVVGRSAGRSPPTVAVASIWRVRIARSAVHVRGGSEPLPPARGPFDRRPSHSNEVDDFFNELLPAAGEHEGSRRPRLALARRRLRAGRAGRRDDGAQRGDVESLAVLDAA